MKKGFTLVEIIISITLILIVGVSATFIIVKNDNNRDKEKLTKQILEAANVYFNAEKDDNGNSFLEEIYKGAKGVKIPLTNLVNKGYIEESVANELYNLTESKRDGQSYYVMFLSGGEDYCDKDQITITSSWMDEGKDFYLCENYTGGGGSNKTFFETLLAAYGGIENIMHLNVVEMSSWDNFYRYKDNYFDVFTTSDFYRESITVLNKYNGLYKVLDMNFSEEYFLYRGNIRNNYVLINDEVFRIIRFDSKKTKLIKEQKIDTSDYIIDGVISGYYNDCDDYNKECIINRFTNSSNYKYLDKWFTDFSSNTDDIYSDGKFCVDDYTTVLNTYNSLRQFGDGRNFINISEFCRYKNEMKFGLISAREAIISGITPYIYLSNNGKLNSSIMTSYYNDAWLVQGDSITTLTWREHYYQYDQSRYLVISKDYIDGDYDKLSAYGAIINTGGGLRPVIVIDNNKINFSGSGTENDPYIITKK